MSAADWIAFGGLLLAAGTAFSGVAWKLFTTLARIETRLTVIEYRMDGSTKEMAQVRASSDRLRATR